MRKNLRTDKVTPSAPGFKKTLEDGNKLLQSQLKNKKKELSFYNDILKSVPSSADLRKSMRSIMEKMKNITGAETYSLLLNDEPLFELIPLRISKKISRLSFNKGVGIAGWILEKGVPVIANDVTKDKRFNRKTDSYSNLDITSLLCAPLKIKDRIVGVLRLINKKRGRKFTEDDLSLLVNASNYVALIVERSFLYEKLKNDELTNLFNARHLNHILEMETERALRYNAKFSIIFMDIDNFKQVNDTFGHLVGSRVLIEIADILRKNLRKVDISARYGGDEFVMILPQTSHEECYMVAERMRIMIEKKVFLKQEGFSIRMTASLGVASFPYNAETKDELLKIADNAMYRGKFSTKNIVFSAK